MADFGSTIFAGGLHSSKRKTGPVTRAIAAMATEAPARRSVLGGIGAALTGTIFGVTPQRADGPDLTGAAEAYIDDCRALGISFAVGPDGDVWFTLPVSGPRDRIEAQNRMTAKVWDRPRLRAAVRAAVLRTV